MEKWLQLLAKSKENMRVAEERATKKLLIECAAQHPLKDDGTPADEFESRLERSVELYNKYKSNGWQVNIFVPGSLHRVMSTTGEYVVDKMPLYQAGERYLIERGVSVTDILAEQANKQYKGEKGVYCSADECFVSANIFLNGDYQRFIAVCSPAQSLRKVLYYLLFETLPIVYTASPEDHTVECFHHYVYEAYGLKEILDTMDTMQGDDCELAKIVRKDRNPFYKEED